MITKPKFFYGYWIILVCFFNSFISSGLAIYLFPIFFSPLEQSFGWTRAEIALAPTIASLISAPFMPIRGRWVDRFGPGKVMAASAFIGGLAYALLSMTPNNLIYFYAMFAIFRLGIMGTGGIAVTATISNWFSKNRGTALGIATTGAGIGGLVLAPIVGGYLIPAFGWRTSYLILGIFTWVLVIPLALLVLKTRPQDMGLYPDGAPGPKINGDSPTSSPSPPSVTGLSIKQAFKTRAFWLIGISFMLAGFCWTALIQHQAVYLEQDVGYSMTVASAAVGFVGMGSAIGKFGFGWLSDRIPPKYCGAISFLLMAIGIVILMNITAVSPGAMVWAYAILIGLAVGGNMPVPAMLIASNFGLAYYGTISGMMGLIRFPGGSSGALVAGFIYDTTNSYQLAFIICLVASIIATLAILMLRHPPPPTEQIVTSPASTTGDSIDETDTSY